MVLDTLIQVSLETWSHTLVFRLCNNEGGLTVRCTPGYASDMDMYTICNSDTVLTVIENMVRVRLCMP
jgi:hypothetical protein